MEKLIILLLIGLGSAVSSYIQKKREREAGNLENGLPPPRSTGPIGPPKSPGAPPPLAPWPVSPREWQEDLRRVLQGNPAQQSAAPPFVPPIAPNAAKKVTTRPTVITPQRARSNAAALARSKHFSATLLQSMAGYTRASQLSARVGARLHAVDMQTEKHKPASSLQRGLSASEIAQRWTHDRQAVREAFIASLIFAPPVGLKTSD